MFEPLGTQIGGFPMKRFIWVGLLVMGIGWAVDLGFHFWHVYKAVEVSRTAEAACKRGDREECIALYTEALEIGKLGPNDEAIIFNGRGAALLDENQFNPAARDFKKAVQLNPEYAEPLENLGLVSFKQKNFGHAIGFFDRAIKLNSDLAFAFYLRGTSYIQLGELERALVDLDMAIKIDPADGGPYLSRGVVYFGMKDYDRAIPDLEKAIVLKPEWKEAKEILRNIKAERASSPPS